ncbi:hypothetical protein D3C76_1746610 [compost metagenome]
MASRDSLAPCRKNSRAMAMSVIHSKAVATWPCAGNRVAVATTASRVRVKLSGRRRERAMVCVP